MKKILTILLICFAFVAKAQIYQKFTTYGTLVKRLKSDSTLLIPTFCGVPAIHDLNVKRGGIAFDSCGHKFYIYDPSIGTWSIVTGSGGTPDTTFTKYPVYAPSPDSIGLRIDSMPALVYNPYATISGLWTGSTLPTKAYVDSLAGAGGTGRFGIEDNKGIQDRKIRDSIYDFYHTVGDDSAYANSEAEYHLSYINGFSVYAQDYGFLHDASLHVFHNSAVLDYADNVNDIFNTVGADSLNGAYLNSDYYPNESTIGADSGFAIIKYYNTTTGEGRITFPRFTGYVNRYSPISVNGTYADVNGNITIAGGGGTDWLLTGNAGTTSSNFIGTTDLQPFIIKTNNVISGQIGITSNYNTALGYNSLPYNTTAFSDNSAFGANSLTNTTGIGNTGIGTYSLNHNSTGTANTSVGVASMFANTEGYSNVAVGNSALYAQTTSRGNIGIGDSALRNVTSGNYNIALGYKAGLGLTTISNTLYIADSTSHFYMKLDSADGVAPSVIGKDGSGSWHTYATYGTKRTAVADVAYTVLATDFLVAYSTLTATRAVTLPSASTVTNQTFIIKDEAGTAGANNITIVGTVDGAANPTAVNTNYGKYILYSNGTNYFTR